MQLGRQAYLLALFFLQPQSPRQAHRVGPYVHRVVFSIGIACLQRFDQTGDGGQKSAAELTECCCTCGSNLLRVILVIVLCLLVAERRGQGVPKIRQAESA